MNADTFLRELDAVKNRRLAAIVGAGQASLPGPAAGDAKAMLQVALAKYATGSESQARAKEVVGKVLDIAAARAQAAARLGTACLPGC